MSKVWILSVDSVGDMFELSFRPVGVFSTLLRAKKAEKRFLTNHKNGYTRIEACKYEDNT